MRYLVAAALIAAAPAVSDEMPLLEKDCMEVIGPAVYGPETYGGGVIVGISLGYAIARGGKAEDSEIIGKVVGFTCRQNPGMTFGDVLRTFDQD